MGEIAEDDCAVDDSTPVRIQVLEADVDRLRDELAGLRRAQESRAGIEQAKGAVMAMTGCTADEAFSLLRGVSQRTNRKLFDVAEDLVSRLREGAVVLGPAGPAPAGAGGATPSAGVSQDQREQSHNAGWRSRTDFPWRLRSVRDDEQLRALVDLAAHLAAAGGWADLVGAVVRRGLADLGARAGALAVLGDDDCLDTWTYGYPLEIAEFYARLPLSTDVPLAVCVRERRPLYLGTREEVLERFPDTPLQIDSQALAALPLVRDQVTLGALGLSYDVPQEYDAGTRAFLEFAAHECALTLARVRDKTERPAPGAE